MAKLGLAVSARAYHDPNPNPGDIEKGLTELKTAGARIIFLNTDFVMDTWCFLAKLKMFGPSYAFLIPSFNEMPIDDPFRSNETADWCTIDMVIHLFESSHFFIFGDVSLSGSSGGNQVDSTGLLGRDFDEVSLNTLEQPDLSFGWDMERHRLYDQTMFAAYWLNATETILNEREFDFGALQEQKSHHFLQKT